MSMKNWAQDDDLGSKMPDGDLEGLASQNAYLQEALETCRRDISSMSHQARTQPPSGYVDILLTSHAANASPVLANAWEMERFRV